MRSEVSDIFLDKECLKTEEGDLTKTSVWGLVSLLSSPCFIQFALIPASIVHC